MKRIGIDINPIVQLREWSGKRTPDPVHVIALLEASGVDSIVYTLSGAPSQNVTRDLNLLHECIHSHFNLRFYPGEQSVQIALKCKAGMLTLVDFQDQKVTSLDLQAKENTVLPMINYLRTKGAIVSALIDPTADQIKAAVRMQCDYIELNTQKYATSDNLASLEQELENLKVIASTAVKYNVSVMASGDLDLTNIKPMAEINEIEEINFGSTLINRAIMVGLQQAVKDFKRLL